MIEIDLGKASWLSATGSVYEIVGAIILIRALLWARPVELFRQAVQTWDGDAEVLRSQCTQKVDALWGTSILVLGFCLQAVGALGVTIGGSIASGLLVVLTAVCVAYQFGGRTKHIRRWYMRAVNEAACSEEVKEAIRGAY